MLLITFLPKINAYNILYTICVGIFAFHRFHIRLVLAESFLETLYSTKHLMNFQKILAFLMLLTTSFSLVNGGNAFGNKRTIWIQINNELVPVRLYVNRKTEKTLNNRECMDACSNNCRICAVTQKESQDIVYILNSDYVEVN